jgi:ribosomal-protein-alanine N-acetyltransferase
VLPEAVRGFLGTGRMTMLEIKQINAEDELPEGLTRQGFIDFMYRHLGQFGDTKSAIAKSIDYAFSCQEGKGGYLLAAYDGGDLVGGLIMNHTGMSEYVPEHLLVYVAVNEEYRNRGFGAQIVEKAFEICEGNVALHVEYENPAKRLYERLGMRSKYAEMRYIK